MEPLSNFHWGFMSIGFMRLYHYIILQPISFITEVNLNSIMCPAVSDPFEGPWYRIAAHLHQTLFILLHGKIYCIIGQKFFVPKHTEIKTEVSQVKNLVDANGNNIEMNGLNGDCCFKSEKLLNGSNLKED